MKDILIVEDSAIIKENLEKLISFIDGVRIVGAAPNYNDAVFNIQKFNPDIIILDIELNGSSGLDILSFIKQDHFNPTVIIFTNYTNEVLKNRAIKNGAHYFLDKSADVDLLIDILIQHSK